MTSEGGRRKYVCSLIVSFKKFHISLCCQQMSLQRLLLPAGGVAVAMSFAHTTVYAAEKKKLYKPSEVSIFFSCELN